MFHFYTPFACADGYKLSHWNQYPAGTEMVYSNFTPRRKLIIEGHHECVRELRTWFEAEARKSENSRPTP